MFALLTYGLLHAHITGTPDGLTCLAIEVPEQVVVAIEDAYDHAGMSLDSLVHRFTQPKEPDINEFDIQLAPPGPEMIHRIDCDESIQEHVRQKYQNKK